MLRVASMAATAALLLSLDAPGILPVQSAKALSVHFPPGVNLRVLPYFAEVGARAQEQSTAGRASRKAQTKASNTALAKKTIPLQPKSVLALIRYVDGEFVRPVNPLPSGKKGFHMTAGEPLNHKQLNRMLSTYGAAVNPGDRAQITKLEFKKNEIVLDVNGGGRGNQSWKNRIHLEVGGIPTMREVNPVPPVKVNTGATLYLDFKGPVPDMTPDQLKQYLSGMLDFSKHSAAVHWIDTLPPKIQKAIEQKRAAVGMNRDMVLTAMGRPDQKVREREPDGTETEDWIYGHPPGKTVFVEFEGDSVVSVKQFPRDHHTAENIP